jgi:HSP20 family protein
MTMFDLIPWKRSEKLPARRDEMDSFIKLRDEMNQLFDSFFDDPWSLRPFEAFNSSFSDFMPRFEVSETDKQWTVSVELPGMDEKDVQVSLENQMLTISGEKKSESKDKGGSTYRSERSYGSFRRQLALPGQVNEDDVSAVFKNGVLTVTLPRSQAVYAAAKKISIKHG